jgi:hypothetical protein
MKTAKAAEFFSERLFETRWADCETLKRCRHLEGLKYNQNHDRDKQYDGNLVVPAIPDMRMSMLSAIKFLKAVTAGDMKTNQPQDKQRFRMNPALSITDSEAEPEYQAKKNSQYAQRRHKAKEFIGHQQ